MLKQQAENTEGYGHADVFMRKVFVEAVADVVVKTLGGPLACICSRGYMAILP